MWRHMEAHKRRGEAVVAAVLYNRAVENNTDNYPQFSSKTYLEAGIRTLNERLLETEAKLIGFQKLTEYRDRLAAEKAILAESLAKLESEESQANTDHVNRPEALPRY